MPNAVSEMNITSFLCLFLMRRKRGRTERDVVIFKSLYYVRLNGLQNVYTFFLSRSAHTQDFKIERKGTRYQLHTSQSKCANQINSFPLKKTTEYKIETEIKTVFNYCRTHDVLEYKSP